MTSVTTDILNHVMVFTLDLVDMDIKNITGFLNK